MLPDEIIQTQNEVTEDQAASSTVEQTPAPSSPQQDAKEGADLNETKQPSQENLIGELRRKLDEVPLLIQQAVMAAQARPNTAPQAPAPQSEESKYKGYTQAQLENVLNHPQATAQDISFATRGLSVLEAKQEVMREVRTDNERSLVQSRQNSALQEIVNDYPHLYNKQSGQWNYSDPLMARAVQLQQSDPRLMQFGNEGLRVAIDRVYAQMAREGQTNLRKKEIKINSQERSKITAQSQSMTAGTQAAPGGGVPKATTIQKLMDAYKKAPEGSRQKADLRTQLFKAKGLIPAS